MIAAESGGVTMLQAGPHTEAVVVTAGKPAPLNHTEVQGQRTSE